jgi:CRISPR/Cas system-associated exonuclease Cas4 (RecB family)
VKGVCANENALGEGGHHWAPKVVPFLTVTHNQEFFVVAVLGLVAGLLLIVGGHSLRRRFGLEDGRTVALDDVTLISRRFGFIVRADQLIRTGKMLIPWEWKSSAKVWPNHRVQVGVAMIVIEDQKGVRPTHGVIACGDHGRHRVENDENLRGWVLAEAGQLREAKRHIDQPISVRPPPAKCRACGMREQCGQARV